MAYLKLQQIVEAARINAALWKNSSSDGHINRRDMRRILTQMTTVRMARYSEAEIMASKVLYIDGISFDGLNSLQMEEVKESIRKELQARYDWEAEDGHAQRSLKFEMDYSVSHRSLDFKVTLDTPVGEQHSLDHVHFLYAVRDMIHVLDMMRVTEVSLVKNPVYDIQSGMSRHSPEARYYVSYRDVIRWYSENTEYFMTLEDAEGAKRLMTEKHWCQIKDIKIGVNNQDN